MSCPEDLVADDRGDECRAEATELRRGATLLFLWNIALNQKNEYGRAGAHLKKKSIDLYDNLCSFKSVIKIIVFIRSF